MILKSESLKPKTEIELEKFKAEVIQIAIDFKTIENDLKQFLRIGKKINALPIEILINQKKVPTLE
jgi:hypothetical protein